MGLSLLLVIDMALVTFFPFFIYNENDLINTYCVGDYLIKKIYIGTTLIKSANSVYISYQLI